MELVPWEEVEWLVYQTESCWNDRKWNSQWPKSLKELQESREKVSMPLPNYRKTSKKCKSWLVACRREISLFLNKREELRENKFITSLSLSYFFFILYVSYPLHLFSVYRKSQALPDEILGKIC